MSKHHLVYSLVSVSAAILLALVPIPLAAADKTPAVDKPAAADKAPPAAVTPTPGRCTTQAIHLVVFDLRDEKAGKREGNKVFSLPPKLADGTDVQHAFDICQQGSDCEVLKRLPALADESNSRWISHKGDLLVGYVIQNENGADFDLDIDEQERSSRITADLGSLLKVLNSLPNAGQTPAITCFEYHLTETRANLKVKVTVKKSTPPRQNPPATDPTKPAATTRRANPANLANPSSDRGDTALAGTSGQNPLEDSEPAPPPTPDGANPAPLPAATQDKEKSELVAELITGPREHWFLSADLPVNKISEAKFDETTGKLEPKEKPSKFLLGVDYMLGDLFDETNRPWWGGITLKLLAEASSSPRDSLGFGIGYRLRPIKFLSLELDTFSLFVGRVRVQEDEKAADGTVRKDQTSYKNVIGLSFNIDKALEWLKKE